MILLFNGTNEAFDMVYAGRSYTIRPDEKMKVEDPMGKHLLNAFGARGLTSLEFGDDEGVVKVQAQEINRDFKKRQILNYNLTNENRKMMNLGYTPPTKKIKEYALELGVKLLEPYTIRDEERDAISDSRKEIDALKKDNAELKELLTRFLAQQEKPETQKGEVEKPTTDEQSDFDRKWPNVRKGKG